MFQEQIDDLNIKLKEYSPEKERLKNLDLFILDNTLRETTVGQLRGHTLENKWEIYEQVKRVGFKNVIIGSFNHQTRVGDTFLRQLISKGEDVSNFWGFGEFLAKVDDKGVPEEDEISIGLLKCKEYGINVIMELDLIYYGIDYEIFTMERLCQLLTKRFRWIRENLPPKSRTFVNIRDFRKCMREKPQRVFQVVNFISSLPKSERIFGLAYEDMGDSFPAQLKIWTKCIRQEMDRCGWEDGHFILHVHHKYGLSDAVNIDCLANGATGLWAGLCEEGAAVGHACTTLAIMNLIRLGNTKVVEKFNCTELRAASRRVTEIVTGKPPYTKQPVCGDRAIEMVFGLESEMCDKKEFNMAEFFGEKIGIRMNTLATAPMIVLKLEEFFGKNESFTLEVATQMKEVMLEDLHANRKEEYNSAFGLAILFDRSGGKLTSAMSDAIEKESVRSPYLKTLIAKIREMWDEWDLRDGTIDDELDFNAFYNGFMAPYFGCYRCEETKKALQCINMDKDDKVDWKEFEVYLKWAAYQYPDTETAEELLDIAFRKGIVPAMQDELLKDVLERPLTRDGESKEE